MTMTPAEREAMAKRQMEYFRKPVRLSAAQRFIQWARYGDTAMRLLVVVYLLVAASVVMLLASISGRAAAGTAGFFSLMFIAPALMKWAECNPWLRYRLAAWAIIGAIGFGSALLLSGHGFQLPSY
ncbi:MAG TPA: hypothetical protein VGX71_13585 [Pseudaminobacter sp.]|nr:hypothetical protein [Pseudaminobacter sp.]